MMEFLAMGGYAFYVWSAYGITAATILIEVLSARSRHHRSLEEARLATPDDQSAATRGTP